MIDLENKTIVQLTNDDLSKIEDLRYLEQDFGSGVKAAWSDEKQGILAFVFGSGWSQEDAEAWVAQAKTTDLQAVAEGESMPYSKISEINPALKGIEPKITLAQANEIAGMADAMAASDNPPESPWAVAIASFKKRYEVKDGKWVKKETAKDATSFDAIRDMVGNALRQKYDSNETQASSGVWVSDINPTDVVYTRDGKWYAVSYSIDGNTVTFGDDEKEVTPKNSWKEARTGNEFILHAFDSRLADGAVAADAKDGLVWKEIIKPGRWFKMDSGREIEVTQEIIDEAARAFDAGLPKFVSVPADTHHAETRGIVPAELNRGFVQKLKKVGDSLFGAFKLTDPQIALGVQDGSIADCSVYLQPDVVHPATGEKYPWVLRHVLLTNTPLVQDLRGFGDIPAGDTGESLTIIRYRQTPGEVTMPEKTPKFESSGTGDLLDKADVIELSGEAASEYAAINALGLSAAEIKTLCDQRAAIEAQAADLRNKAREMEVARIVLALEGKEEHPKVKAIAGTRHYPVLINAVSDALRKAPKDMALDAGMDGVSALDALILDIVNAVPEDARIKADATDGGAAKGSPKPRGDEVTDEQLDKFIEIVG